MLNTIFSSFSKGFFYTIGRIIALLFIFLVIYTLISKFSDKVDFDSFDPKDISTIPLEVVSS